jgi:hypothetical protein
MLPQNWCGLSKCMRRPIDDAIVVVISTDFCALMWLGKPHIDDRILCAERDLGRKSCGSSVHQLTGDDCF